MEQTAVGQTVAAGGSVAAGRIGGKPSVRPSYLGNGSGMSATT